LQKHDKHVKEIDALKTSHMKSSSETNGHHASMEQRVTFLEEKIRDSVEKHQKDLVAHRSKVEEVRGHLLDERSQREAHVSILDELRKSHSSVSSSLMERLDFLESSFSDTSNRHKQEIAAAHSQLDLLHNNFSDNTGARDALVREVESIKAALAKHSADVHGHLADERSQRDMWKTSIEDVKKAQSSHQSSLSDRVKKLERTFTDSSVRLAADVVAQQKTLCRRIDALDHRLNNDLGGLHELVNNDKHLRTKHYESVQ